MSGEGLRAAIHDALDGVRVRNLQDGHVMSSTDLDEIEEAVVAALAAPSTPEPSDPTDRRCVWTGCVATWRHSHGGFPGGYDNPADPEGLPIVFTDPDPDPGAVRDYNGATLLAAPSTPDPSGDFGLRSTAQGLVDALEYVPGSALGGKIALVVAALRPAPSTPEPSGPYWDGFAAGVTAGFADGMAYTARAAPSTEPALDAAWVEAEASLPPGCAFQGLHRSMLGMKDQWVASYSDGGGWFNFYGPTPTDALRALTARLAESQP